MRWTLLFTFTLLAASSAIPMNDINHGHVDIRRINTATAHVADFDTNNCGPQLPTSIGNTVISPNPTTFPSGGSTSSQISSWSSSMGTPSTSTSSPQPTTPPSAPTGPLLSNLFPVAALEWWTTCSESSGAMPLSDDTLKPFKVASGLTHDYVTYEGKTAMRAHYPEGSYIPSRDPRGGISFYAPGPDSLDFTKAREATLGYSVFFPQGFEWVKGGKLPGLYGGDDADISVSCSGGRRSDACFSARMMWRADGAGEMYTYLPTGFPTNSAPEVCAQPPLSECNPTYGASIARGSFTFPEGQWTTVSERVRLNTPGQADGELELFVNGQSTIKVNNVVLQNQNGVGRIRGIQMQTFFGGSTPDWASPKDQDIYFADFSAAITEYL